jgi:hypothetical protein
MATKRTRRARERSGITPEAVTAWQAGDWHGVNRALGVKPWQVSPFDVDGPKPPTWAADNAWAESWPWAWEARKALIELAGPPGRVGRHGEPLGPARVLHSPGR